jgi:bacteriocin-type transport-associated protein
MSDLLLRELSNADIDWLVTTGTRQQLTPNEVLIHPERPVDALFLLLEGTLSVRLSKSRSGSSDINNSLDSHEIATMTRGELFGESWLFKAMPVVGIVAAGPAVVLVIPQSVLLDKLHQDVDFAAHFYRVLALIMSERIRRIFEHPEKVRYGSSQVVKEALFVFSELRDSDIDWMISTGTVEKLSADKVLLQAGRPVDALHTVLDGQLAITIVDQPCDPLSMCWQGLESQGAEQPFRTATYISRGGLPGIISFLDFRPLPVTIRAVSASLLLTIPRRKVAIKLQEDLGFASRFYRVIATQTVNLLRSVTLLHSEIDGKPSSALADTDEDELNLEELQRVSEGAAKFDWMLRQLGVGCG